MSYKKELTKTNQKEFRVENAIKRNGDKLYVKGTATIILLTTAELIKNT